MPPRKPKPKKPPTPKAAKPWDIRPTQPTGSPIADEVYLAVGKALSAWEGVEVQLSQLYLFFIGRYYLNPADYRKWISASLRAYGSVTNFATRIEMVESAGESFFHPRSSFFPLRDRDAERKLIAQETILADEFVSLMKATRGFVARRNDIAHGIVSGTRQRIRLPLDELTYFLSPPDYNTRKHPRSADRKSRTVFESAIYHYRADDIDCYREQFSELRAKFFAFFKRGEILLTNDRSREREEAARFQRR